MRKLAIGIVVVVALSAAAVADRYAPATLPRPAGAGGASPGVVWACPVVKGANAPGWIHLANAARTASAVHITFIPDGATPVALAVTVEPGRALTVGSPPAVRQAAGALVETAGGEVVVSRTAFAASSSGRFGGAAATCSRVDTDTTVIPFGSTLQAETLIAVMNPATTDAVVDISIASDGQRLQPETLRGRVVPARKRLLLRAGDFAFDAATIAVVVTARSGRVVAEGLLAHGGFLELIPGGPPVPSLVAIASSSRGPAGFSTVGIGDADAVVEARLLSSTGQAAFEPLASGIPPDTPLVATVPPAAAPAGPLALALESATSPLGVAASWQVAGGRGLTDQAITVGTTPARRSAAVIGLPATPGSVRMLLAVPEAAPAIVDIALLTEAGPLAPAELQGVRIEPGRTAMIGMPAVPATSAIGVLVTSNGSGVAMVLEATATIPDLFGAYGVVGTPSLPQPAPGILIDPRIGIPVA